MELIVEQLLKEVERVYSTEGKLTDELLSALHFVFQSPLQAALDLIDKQNVTLVTSPSGRQVYQVVGSSGSPYTCLTTSLYCSCPAYRYSVLLREDHMMCKHTLAARLGSAMNLCKNLEVLNQEMANIIISMD